MPHVFSQKKHPAKPKTIPTRWLVLFSVGDRGHFVYPAPAYVYGALGVVCYFCRVSHIGLANFR